MIMVVVVGCCGGVVWCDYSGGGGGVLWCWCGCCVSVGVAW